MFRLAHLSLANRALIALVTVLASVFGVITMSSLKQELIPSIEFPQVSVITSLPGSSPEVIDKQVSEPLEAALNAVEGLDSSTATSRSGVSTINLQFVYGTNLDRARSQVDRAISNARQQLPDDADPQSITGSISDLPIVYLAVSSGDESLSALRQRLATSAVPKLQKIDGVRSADVAGGATQSVRILPDNARLARAGLSVTAIRDALQNNGDLVPAGTVRQGKNALDVQFGSPITSLAAVRALPVSGRTDPTVVTIGDVASVALTDDTATSITRTNGEATLSVAVTKKPEGDAVGISHAVRDLVPELQAEVGGNARFITVFDQAPFIEKSIKDLTTEGLLGLGFAVLVILVFLLSVRSTLVTAISIPLSLLITFIGMAGLKYSLNILTLGALTIAIGRVVDDSIVVIENIKRHLEYGQPKRQAILEAIREVAGAVTASTLTTVAVFAPIAFVGDLAGELFRPFALTVTMALLASLIVALTIVPVLAYWFLGDKPVRGTRAERRAARRGRNRPATTGAPAHAAPVAGASAANTTTTASTATTSVDAPEDRGRGGRLPWLQRAYLPILGGTQRHPVITVAAAALILAITALLLPMMKTNLLGDSGQNSFSIKQALPAGTSLQATSDAAKRVESTLRGIDGVRTVQVNIGNASGGLSTFLTAGASTAQYTVITDEKRDQTALRETVRRTVTDLRDVGTVTLSTQSGGFGTSSTVNVTISAATSDLLTRANDVVVKGLTGVSDARDVSSNLAANQPVVQVSVDRAAAARLGVNENALAGILAARLSPIPGGTVRLNDTDYQVKIGNPPALTSVDTLRNLPIPAGPTTIPLSRLADVSEKQVATSITVSTGRRTAVVSVTPAGTDLGAVSRSVQDRLSTLTLPTGAEATIGGAAVQQANSFRQLGLALLAAIAIVYVIMVATFKSLAQPLILLVSVPFAATGAIGLLVATQIPLGLASLVGLLMLVGIVVTNAIVLIDLINQYRRPAPGRPAMSLSDAISTGARRRLRPILMTALATIFALIPMALGMTGGGGFISQPLAVVVIGGLVSSTALTLVLVPVLYRLLEGWRERRAARHGQSGEPDALTNDADGTTPGGGAAPEFAGAAGAASTAAAHRGRHAAE
ncbi:efflux RND transporter permease subunit [Tersicoccus sp. Bi-70]|uniref:efflux RND transporter permease subunit n=1 Tax=Tersicoccus sp. Bi-70 TaxID=1897634 RepID=UPI0009755588|nr:efflux RND transporter permease subunit [Tersicoccus sp. Bi-70]OMH36699.1 hydrogenase expression protein [Tersicoccus sp. Bi-70]